MSSLYDILGLDKSASQEDIKKRYRTLAVENHPDKGGNEEKMKGITSAYNILKDPIKRERYDKTGSVDAEESFEMRFRNMLHNVFSAIVDSEDDVEHKDLIKILVNELKAQEKRQREVIKSLLAEKQKLEKVLSRIKKDGGFIKPVIENKILGIDRAVANTEDNITFICECIKSCSEFEYEVDEDVTSELDELQKMLNRYKEQNKSFFESRKF